MIEKVYKLIDSKPPVFARVLDNDPKIAWGNWYQWSDDKETRCLFGGGVEWSRVVSATEEEIAIFDEKVKQFEKEVLE